MISTSLHPTLYNTKVDDRGLLINQPYPDENNFITVDLPEVTYAQRDDVNSDDDFQELRIGTDSSGVGHYYYIKTDRWAFDNIKSLVAVLEDYEKRFTVLEDDDIEVSYSLKNE